MYVVTAYRLDIQVSSVTQPSGSGTRSQVNRQKRAIEVSFSRVVRTSTGIPRVQHRSRWEYKSHLRQYLVIISVRLYYTGSAEWIGILYSGMYAIA